VQSTAGQWTASRVSRTLSTRRFLRRPCKPASCIWCVVGAFAAPSSFLNVYGWKDRKNVAKDLKRIYQATDDVEAEKALADFEAGRGQKYPSIVSAVPASLIMRISDW
jgi:hypothetical protein